MTTAVQQMDASTPAGAGAVAGNFRTQLERVNKELWLVLSLFVIAALFNTVVASQRMLLGFYTVPTIVSAYLYGRRHATPTAFFSALLVVLMRYFNPELFGIEFGRITTTQD